ncbi:outer membrane beta-barrel protein [Methylobacterium sp. C25]|uniref:outer membrane beta-barrel protein n=1 Tax=Methylobacterium sp. C25 TaxID=2721622 RepID=UPI001F32194E|nr:outer membrane beta-barrel protein [Methylobacterium sp. C25]MCE4226706.1 outer membrane beta-barrel protein [Methylobacterium sp. C25]
MRAALFALPLIGWSAAAFAADLPVRTAPVVVAPPLFTWGGYYGGLFAGYGTIDDGGRSVCVSPAGGLGGTGCATVPSLRRDSGDFVAGSGVGYNYQLGSGVVLGVEGDIAFTRLRGYALQQGVFPLVGGGNSGPGTFHIGQSLDSLSTIRGRLGYAFGKTLIYATGGVAGGEVRIDADGANLAQGSYGAHKTDFRLGYAVGAGIEQAFTSRLSVKVEGLYYDLGDRTVLGVNGAGIAYGNRVETSGYLARIGLNYRLGNEIGDVLPGFSIINDILHPSTAPAPVATTWDFETGERYFYSSGSHRYSLGAPGNAGQLNSQLNYGNFSAHSAETFARLDHNPTGLFLKGFFGSGFVNSGKLNDRDVPPAVATASNAVSKIKDGDIAYAAIDAGYTFLQGSNYRLGGFLGYQYYSELANGFGCSQVGGGAACSGGAQVPTNVKVVSEDAHWNAMRVGLVGEVRYDRFKLSLEGAYLPVVHLDGYDHHWLRPTINPLAQTGSGDGYFLQGIVSYELSPTIGLGVGGRYWKMNADSGRTQFPFLPSSPTKFETDRYGGFVQITHKLPDLGLASLITK